MYPHRLAKLAVAFLYLLITISPSSAARAADGGALTISSSAFADGAAIGREFSCDGTGGSPPLSWSNVPETTRSFVLIVSDPDAPHGTFYHWVIFNLPAQTRTLAAGAPTTETLADGADQGFNSARRIGYTAPCPPRGPAHHYHFKLYALDSMLALKPGETVETVESAISGHVLASAELVGVFGH
ncbi:MAG: YbhB/YbcL family Raf kinase inhibitor-like protein [Candidatus Binataceae bacterium]